MSTLIAYFSRADENYFAGALRYVTVGNTETAARLLSQITGGGLFRLDPVVPYARDYNTCIAQAQEDQRRDARPELIAYPEDIRDYDVIYLGYPNYWGTMPMPVFTFLERFDFAGKRILPFCTHEGSGLGRSEGDIRRLCPGAQIGPGLALLGSRVGEAGPALQAWVSQSAPAAKSLKF